MSIPQGTTHRLFGRPDALVQYYKLGNGKWYFWSDTTQQWWKNFNTLEWIGDNLVPINL